MTAPSDTAPERLPDLVSDVASEPEPAPIPVEVTVNGDPRALSVEARRSLADVLNRALGLPGTQVGCELGACGTCTVLVNGEPARACLMLAVQADGTEVETVESLARDGRLNALQKAFSEKYALQCGFCTPGFLMLATALLRKEPDASRERIRESVSANLCRCGGYSQIIDAIESVATAGADATAGDAIPGDAVPRDATPGAEPTTAAEPTPGTDARS
ncbi:(2Fe-2S)-binding protein [Wenjunlia tyrosinilytica]|uniref:2Fe-2S ferredoxin-type domain-containing protein n=1 Tax=Wenjunlia tyrosinilytica TaxID=1544741 RepID=A0A918A2B6_9ACTN|nr:(2Fe-2S)-binding protein [Wenjunlia tyrosinilytica]GGP01312.1 hypothetical protein GCM10012280_71910 [Wenjunlia tyrosinilytica]